MESKDDNATMEQLSSYLSSHDFNSLNNLISDQNAISVLANNVLDVVPTICTLFDEHDIENYSEFILSCQNLLIALAEYGNPKETVIVILEQIDRFQSKLCFVSMLKPLIIVFKKLPKKQNSFLKWVLETLYACVKTFPMPSHANEDIIKVQNLEDVTHKFLMFMDELISWVLNLQTSYSDDVQRRDHLWNSLINIVQYPLVNFEYIRDENNRIFHCYNSVMKLLTFLKPNLFVYFESLYENNECENYESSKFGIAGLCYLLLCEYANDNNQPFVYTHQYKLFLFLRYCNVLLHGSNDIVLTKGYLTCVTLLNGIENSSLESDVFDLEEFHRLPELLINVMISNPNLHLRQNSLKVFHSFVDKFDDKGRYLLVYNLIKKFNHSGIRGLLISKYKDHLSALLDSRLYHSHFDDVHFTRMLKLMLTFEHENGIDLLENSDQIISALNFLRFVVLKDTENITGIFNVTNKVLYNNFIEEMQKNVKISRAHHLLEIENIIENKQSCDDVENIINLEDFPEKPYDKINVLRSALNTFDLIFSLVVRFEELLSIKISNNVS